MTPRMATAAIVTALVANCITACALAGDDASRKEKADSERLVYLLSNPNDVEAIAEFREDCDSEIGHLNFFREDPQAARAKLQDFSSALDRLKPTTDAAKEQVERGRRMVRTGATYIDVSQQTLEALERKLAENPHDYESFSRWRLKASWQIESLAYRNSDQAVATLEAVTQFAAKIAASTTNAELLRDIRRFPQPQFLQRTVITYGRRSLALVGKEAPELNAESWINSPPLSLPNLKGKVVLLDFFHLTAQRRSSIPHIQTWHEKHTADGLVVIGVTRSPFGRWDPGKKRFIPANSSNPPTPEQRLDTLKQAVDYDRIKYPFAVRDIPTAKCEFGLNPYSCGLVLIDRQGIVRMVRVPETERDAGVIGVLLAELLKEK